jgi:hypothetical protein
VPAAELSDRELRLLRLRSQGLLEGSRSATVVAATKSALCLQAQDVGAAALAARARTRDLTFAEVAAQGRRKSLCRAWLMRNTIHLFAARDHAWMRPLLAERPRIPAIRRLADLGVDEPLLDHALKALRKRVGAGPLPRREALELIKAQGVKPHEVYNPIYWVVHVAALDGILVVRPAFDRTQAFEPAPEAEVLDRDEGLGRLARRYLRAYSPGSPRDFAYWGKITLGDARHGWERAGRLVEVGTSRGTLSAVPGALEPLSDDGVSVRLLGLWDNYLLGHEGRELIVPRPAAGWVHPGGGLLKQTAFADGLAFGTWRLERKGVAVTIELEVFDRIPRGARAGLEAEVADIGRFFDADARLKFV